jgi:hypothetical protein
VPSQRRTERAEKQAVVARDQRRRTTGLAARGERPPGPFGGLPVSEIAILAGGVAVVVGIVQGGGAALIVGFVVCALGVLEVTAREHFTGYRSHAMLLAAVPSVGLELALVAIVGGGRSHRALLLVAVLPVFALLTWLLRKRYRVAHHARMVRRPRA